MTDIGSANQYAFEGHGALLARLIEECCRCTYCGYIQAEPNWCHRCRRRVEMPQWATSLLEEHTALIKERDILREELDRYLSAYGA